ncbi:hypothetical protein CDIK_1736 [Cucumispora dikerogammari]|nr:hypothetical protein CDIK_1736 [Cucumispora dikerogammari]
MTKKEYIPPTKQISRWQSFKSLIKDCFKPMCYIDEPVDKNKLILDLKKIEKNKKILKQDIKNSKKMLEKPKKPVIVNLKSKNNKITRKDNKNYDNILKKYKTPDINNSRKLNKKLYKKILKLLIVK